MIRAVKISVVVKIGTYGGNSSNYRIMEEVAQCRPEKYKFSTSLPDKHVNNCVIKIWLNNIKGKLM